MKPRIQRCHDSERFRSGRLIGALLILCLIATFTVDTGSAQETGRVTGVVINGTTGEPESGIEVSLSRFEEVGPESQDVTLTTGVDGRFTFESLDASPGFAYVASTRYQRVLYSTGMILLSREPEQDVEIRVYAATDDDSVVTMHARGVVIAGVNTDDGIVTITDLSVISNGSSRTYTGDDDGRTIRFHVPGNAIQVTPRSGFDFTNAMIEDATIFTVTPLRPGTVNATLDYTVPYTGASVSFPVQSSYATEIVRVLIPVTDAMANVSVRSDGSQLSDAGIVDIEGSSYHVWTVEYVPAGSSVNVTLVNLPPTEMVHNELRTAIPAIVAFTVLVMAVGVTGTVVARRGLFRERPIVLPETATQSLDERRAELSEQLRELEARRTLGDVNDQEYSATRRMILEDLRRIYRQYRGLGDDE